MPYWRLYYHVVWSTQGREPLIGSEEERVIRWSLRDTCNENKIIPHAIGVMPDHVHVAVSIPPSVLLSTVIGRIKGASAHAINHNGHWTSLSPFAWQGEYGIHSFGETALPTVVAYVHNQQSHHAKNTHWPGLERTTDKPPHPHEEIPIPHNAPKSRSSAGLSESARGLQPRAANTANRH